MRDLARLPKAQLHVHLESTVRAGTAAEVADRHGAALPSATRTFGSFAELAEASGRLRDCLREPADCHRIAVEPYADEAADGVIGIGLAGAEVCPSNVALTELVRRRHRGIDAWLDDDQPADPRPEEHP